jgi:UPF0755 protein
MDGRSASPSLRFSCLAALAAVVCGLVAGLTLIVLSTPGQAETRIGSPAPALDPIQRSLLGAYLLLRAGELDAAAGEAEASLELEVLEGETANQVVERLEQAGVVRDGFLLRAYLRYRGMDVGIEAGRYQVTGAMTVRQLAEVLQTARPLQIVLVVLEGWRRDEIAAALPPIGLSVTIDEFLAATESPPGGYSISADMPVGGSLEGFLFPDTYHLDPDASGADVVAAMIANFDRRVGPDLRQAFEARGLSLLQAVTLASIVEREAILADERPLIASVFLNRLAAGMNLDADPTVQYALGLQPDGQWWKSPLTAADLAFDSPYNTYLYAGLPPGPIANPGLASLQAVAFPADSAYLYFRAMCDGSGRHAFALTYEEHLQNACP